MNLVLHGLFLQVIASIVQFQHGSTLCSAGEPGYLDFDNLPETNFSCQGKVIGGYYADVEAGCQMFHVCTIGQKDEIMDIKFLCLNGTVFDQETRVCERVDEVDCSKSERFYNLNLELYGNNAVTLSLHETNPENEEDPSDLADEDVHELQRTTSARPSTTSTPTPTTTTTQRPVLSSTTSSSGSYQGPNGYPQHYQPQPRFPSVQTSQSKSLYDDKNGGYHHRYIYHAGDHRTNNLGGSSEPNGQNQAPNDGNDSSNDEATSYQLYSSNQGVVATTGSPRIHQIHYSSTSGPQIQIRNDHQPTLSPIFHATSSTIQTLLNSNANSPALINPIFHSHGIASTTERFDGHNNNPRETDEYDEDDVDEESQDGRRPLEAIQPTAEGKVSKLKISQIAVQRESVRTVQRDKDDPASDQQRIKATFLPSSSHNPQAIRSFYPTPRTPTKSTSSHVTQHIHVPPPVGIPQLKPHRVTINLSPPDIQRIVQNPSPLLPSQSRVIVTAKASVSDESGRPLNSTQLVTLPLPTIPASYDDYKEGDESFDPFYRDVPKIRNHRRVVGPFRRPLREPREVGSLREKRHPKVDEVEKTRVREGAKGDSGGAVKFVDESLGFPLESPEVHEDDGKRSTRRKRDTSVDEMEETRIDGSAEMFVQNGSDDDGNAEDDEKIPEVAGNPADASSGRENEEDPEMKPDPTDAAEDEVLVEEYASSDDAEKVGGEIEHLVDSPEDTFDGKILEESGGQTSKEIDTRAVNDSKYSRDRNNRRVVGPFRRPLREPREVGSLREKRHPKVDEVEKTRVREGAKGDSGGAVKFVDESLGFPLESPEVHEDDGKRSTRRKRDTSIDEMEETRIDGSAEMFVQNGSDDDGNAEADEKIPEVAGNPAEASSGRENEEDPEMKPDPTDAAEDEVLVEEYASSDDAEKVGGDIEHLVDSPEDTFDGKILEESGGQTSKEIDTRAVNDSKYSRDRNKSNSFDDDGSKSSEGHPKALGKTGNAVDDESSRFSLELPEVVDSSEESRSKEEEKREQEEERSDEGGGEENASEERKSSGEDYNNDDYYYEGEVDSSSLRSNEEDFVEYSNDPVSETSREKNDEASRSEEADGEEERDYETSGGSTTRNQEEVGSHEDGERPNGSQEAKVAVEGISASRRGKSSEEPHATTDSDENTSSAGKNVSSKDPESYDDSYGVLKFTDEIPAPEDANRTEETMKSSEEEVPQDYIDDNYEPESYKENKGHSAMEDAVTDVETLREVTTMPVEKEGEEMDDGLSSVMEAASTKNATDVEDEEERQKDEPRLEKTSGDVGETRETMENPGELEEVTTTTEVPTTTTIPSTTSTITTSTSTTTPATTTSTSTTTPATTTSTSTTTTTSTSTTTTTSTSTTTTSRPTPPKLFKPFTLRKSYVYIPPSTTPVPVVIKPRLALLNPKPAKPPKSYNENAPKPIIRKSLFARKIPPPLRAATSIDEAETSTETTSIDPTEVSKSSTTMRIDENVNIDGNDIPSTTSAILETLPATESHTFAPYPLFKMADASSTTSATEADGFRPDVTENGDVESNNVPSVTAVGKVASIAWENSTKMESATSPSREIVVGSVNDDSSSNATDGKTLTNNRQTPEESATKSSTTNFDDPMENDAPTLTPLPKDDASRANRNKQVAIKRVASFNCLEKEMYRFYADGRDCRLFHYCSPGFTPRQLLDFRFVCEEGTFFDEKSQNCVHDVKNPKCRKRVW